MEIDDALLLLSFYFRDQAEVRSFAVKFLEDIPLEEVERYLLQLVQALRYDKVVKTDLMRYLIRRCTESVKLGIRFYWYLTVEAETSPPYKSRLDLFLSKANQVNENLLEYIQEQTNLNNIFTELTQLSHMAGPKASVRKARLQELIATDYSHVHSFSKNVLVLCIINNRYLWH